MPVSGAPVIHPNKHPVPAGPVDRRGTLPPPSHTGAPRTYTPGDIARVIELRGQGRSLREIVAETGIGYGSVRRMLAGLQWVVTARKAVVG